MKFPPKEFTVPCAMADIDLNKTLDELEGTPIGEPSFPSGLAIRICRLYRERKLADYQIEHYRLLITQRRSMRFLIPLAIARLELDPWMEDDESHPGILLDVVLGAPFTYWDANPSLVTRMIVVINEAMAPHNFQYIEEYYPLELENFRDRYCS